MITMNSSTSSAVQSPEDAGFDEAQLAAAAFLARYSGRTLEAYRQTCGASSSGPPTTLAVLAATRPHIELYRGAMEQRGLAASTIDRRLSTVCGFYRFAHIDGRIRSNPAQYVRRPKVHPTDAAASTARELGMFLFTAERYDRAHAALAVLLGLNGLRVSEACATNIEDLGRRARPSHAADHRQGQQARHHPARAPDRPHDRPRRRRTPRRADPAPPRRSAPRPPHRAPLGALDRQARRPRSQSTRTCCARRSSWPPSTPASRCATCSSPPATPTREPRRSTTAAARTSTATPPTSSSPSSPAADRRSDRHFGDTAGRCRVERTVSLNGQ